MKRTFLLLPLFFAFYASAQEPYYDFKKFKANRDGGIYIPLDDGSRSEVISKDSLEKLLKNLEGKKYSLSFGELVTQLPNGTNVYILPQDNMPCLIPDLSRTNYHMPILMNGKRITGMPPGSAPNRNLPKGNTNKKPLQ